MIKAPKGKASALRWRWNRLCAYEQLFPFGLLGLIHDVILLIPPGPSGYSGGVRLNSAFKASPWRLWGGLVKRHSKASAVGRYLSN